MFDPSQNPDLAHDVTEQIVKSPDVTIELDLLDATIVICHLQMSIKYPNQPGNAHIVATVIEQLLAGLKISNEARDVIRTDNFAPVFARHQLEPSVN